MNVYALAFLVGWLRGLGWKRLLFRSDNERALRAFLCAAAMGLKGVEVIEQACPERDHKVNGLAEVTGARSQSTDSSAEKSVGRKTQETIGVDFAIGNMAGSALRKLLVEVHNPSRWKDAWSSSAQKNDGDVKLSNLERNQHFFLSQQGASDA